MGGASGTFPAQRGECVIISVKTAVSNPFTLLSMVVLITAYLDCVLPFFGSSNKGIYRVL